MQTRSPKLADVRQALSGNKIDSRSAQLVRGGGRPAMEPIRLATPFVVDTDRP